MREGIKGLPFILIFTKMRDLHVSITLGREWGLEHLKIETRFRGEKFESVKSECVRDD